MFCIFLKSYSSQAPVTAEESSPKAEVMDGAVDFGYSIQVKIIYFTLE